MNAHRTYRDILAHHNSPAGQAEYAANRARRAAIDAEIEAELRADVQARQDRAKADALRLPMERLAADYLASSVTGKGVQRRIERMTRDSATRAQLWQAFDRAVAGMIQDAEREYIANRDGIAEGGR